MITLVTGTDTDVGKTVVTAWLALAELRRNHRVAVDKPAQTGVSTDEPGDAWMVGRLAVGTTFSEGIRLPEPLAPVRAAIRAGVALPTLTDHVTRIDALAATHDAVFVEGSGGVTVPLSPAVTLLDIGCALAERPAVIVVARAGLGTLNHTALTCRAVRDAGLDVEGIVLGAWPDDPDLATRCNALDIAAAAQAPLLGALRTGCTSPDLLANAWIDPLELT